MVRQIPLTQGEFALVDDGDYDYFMRWKWQLRKRNHTNYASRGEYIKKTLTSEWKQTARYLHREIMAAKHGETIDHINGNGLDNRRENLRICKQSENRKNNNKTSKKTSSKYKGVSWEGGRCKWQSYINDSGERTHLGYYTTEDAAARAYNAKAAELHGDFAKLNEIEE